MIRGDTFVDFITWCAAGGVFLFLAYAYSTSSTAPSNDSRTSDPTSIQASADGFPEHLFDGYVVTTVKDGDSMVAKRGDNQIEIRVAGIDCPEYGQPFFAEAKRTTEQFCLNRPITAKRLDTDRYGRLIATVVVGSADLAEHLLAHGMAWHFKKYDSSERLANVERIARETQMGLWSHPNPVPPWEHRDVTRREENLRPPTNTRSRM